jgi:predicted component of type VI protein secretion system
MNKDGNYSLSTLMLIKIFVHLAVQHERGPRKAKSKILSVSSMILPTSTGSTAPPVACSSSPTMANASAISIANQFNRKLKHPSMQHQQHQQHQQLPCLPTMDNYNPFSSIINQVRRKSTTIFNSSMRNTLFS